MAEGESTSVCVEGLPDGGFQKTEIPAELRALLSALPAVGS